MVCRSRARTAGRKGLPFAVDIESRMIGMVDIDEIGEREGTLGYWLDRATWGRGYAFEAAHAVTRFALDDVGLTRLKAGHADDNPTSGRILTMLGLPCSTRFKVFSQPTRREHCKVPLQAHITLLLWHRVPFCHAPQLGECLSKAPRGRSNGEAKQQSEHRPIPPRSIAAKKPLKSRQREHARTE